MGFKLDGILGIYGKKGETAIGMEGTKPNRPIKINLDDIRARTIGNLGAALGRARKSDVGEKTLKAAIQAGKNTGSAMMQGGITAKQAAVAGATGMLTLAIPTQMTDLFLIFLIVIHVIDAVYYHFMNPLARLMLYGFALFFGITLVFKENGRMTANSFKTSLFICGLGYAWPFISYFPGVQKWFLSNALIVWFPIHIILYFGMLEHKSKLVAIVGAIYIIACSIVIIPDLAIIAYEGTPIGELRPDVNVLQGYGSGLSAVGRNTGKAWASFLNLLSGNVSAIGLNTEIYGPDTAVQGPAKGIYLDPVRASWTWEGDSKTIVVKLRVEEGTTQANRIKLENKCRIKGKDEVATNEEKEIGWDSEKWQSAYPASVTAIKGYQISCPLYGRPSEEKINVIFASKYEFTTTSKLTTYFVKATEIGTFVNYADEADFFRQNSLLDQKPISKSEDAPFKLAIGSAEPPIGLNNVLEIPLEIDLKDITYGYTGVKLDKLKSVEIDMPKALRISKCNDKSDLFSRQESGNIAVYSADSLEGLEEDPYIICYLIGNPDELISGDYAKVTFTATAKYDVMVEKTESIEVRNPAKESVSGTGGGNINVDAIKAEKDVINKIKVAASAHNVPADYAVAIAITESNLNHYNPDGTVKRGGSGEYGIMQILPSTGEGNCPGYDFTDIDQNIECGIIIMRIKCDAATAWGVDGPCDRETSGLQAQCGTIYHGWDIMARLYNGCCPCNGYVESINRIRSEITSQGLV